MDDKTDIELMQQALNDLEALVAYIKGGEPDLFMQVPSIEALRERLARPDPLQRLTDVQQEIEAALAPEQKPQPRRIALDSEALYLRAKQKAEKEAALSWPEGNKRKRLQEELTDRYFYEYTGGRKYLNRMR